MSHGRMGNRHRQMRTKRESIMWHFRDWGATVWEGPPQIGTAGGTGRKVGVEQREAPRLRARRGRVPGTSWGHELSVHGQRQDAKRPNRGSLHQRIGQEKDLKDAGQTFPRFCEEHKTHGRAELRERQVAEIQKERGTSKLQGAEEEKLGRWTRALGTAA